MDTEGRLQCPPKAKVGCSNHLGRATARFLPPVLSHSRRMPHPPAASREGGSALRGRASDIFDCDVACLVFLAGADFDLDMTAERGQKAHQPFQ
jgi:hypothetical protein